MSLFRRIVQFIAPHLGRSQFDRETNLELIIYGSETIKKLERWEATPEKFATHLLRRSETTHNSRSEWITILAYFEENLLDSGLKREARELIEEIKRIENASNTGTDEDEIDQDNTPSQPPDLIAGAIIARRYKLIQRIGDESGQATVWQIQDITDPELPPQVIKCLKPHPSRDYMGRFREEIRSVRELNSHPNIITIFDHGVDRGLGYIVMPMMAGSLRGRMDDDELSNDDILRYLEQIADGLDFAHSKGITHRDLKPANMLFTSDTDTLCLADFGISYRAHRQDAITGTGETAATEEYAAPEQLRSDGKPVPQTDIYALAIIAYELLARERPYTGTKQEIAAAHLDMTRSLPEHERLSVPVLEALRIGASKSIAERPATASQFIKILRDALAGKMPGHDQIDRYLDEILPRHILSVGSIKKLALLDKTFTPLDALTREQQAPTQPDIDPILLDDDLDDPDYDPEWDELDPDMMPLVEPAGEFYATREDPLANAEYVADIRERIKDLQRVVVLGAPGAGKTFLLARLALDYREAHKNNPTGALPLFVPLSMYDTNVDFSTYAEQRYGALAEHQPRIWLLDALNEMPQGKGQTRHLQAFITELVKQDVPFVLSCRVRDYQEQLRDVPHLHRVDLQDLNPQQIYTIMLAYLPEATVQEIWRDVMHADGVLEAWDNWQDSVREFWKRPTGWLLSDNDWCRRRVHDDPRKLLLLCRSPFTLVRLLIPRMRAAVKHAAKIGAELHDLLNAQLPNNRAKLFGQVIEDMITEEGTRKGWSSDDIESVNRVLDYTAAALQATEQRTEIALSVLLDAEDSADDCYRYLTYGRDAGLLTVTDTDVRFNHQLFQEYFATSELRKRLDDYSQRHPDWEQGTALPPRDEKLSELFPNWWEVGGWRVTVTLLGELEGRTGINRVVRWLASYAPEIALNCVLDNNDNLTIADLTDTAREALIAGAHARTDEVNPLGRASAYRVLGHPDINADKRKGVGTVLVNGVTLPEVEWVHIPAGDYTYQDRTKTLDYDFLMARYPVTCAQFEAFVQADDGFSNDAWWEGLAKRQKDVGEQRFKFSNHPRENVSWYDAIAFCRWLSHRYWQRDDLTRFFPSEYVSKLPHKMGYELMNPATWLVRLPTEFEWEKAARANTGWEYPWGDEFDKTKGNTHATSIGQTSAVGIFPTGDAQHWQTPISDLSGNVWEWCLTDYRNPAEHPPDENMSSNTSRVLRGGSWYDLPDYARAVGRDDDRATDRILSYGFRVCVPLLR